MKLATKILGVALTATALCGVGVGVGTASAATPEGGHRVSAAAAATATDAPTTTVVAYHNDVAPGEMASLPAFFCSPDQPYLVNKKLSPGNEVPNGVQVEARTATVRIHPPANGRGGLAIGWTYGMMENHGSRDDSVTVSIVCTSSAADGYQA